MCFAIISEYCDRPTWASGAFNEIAYAARTGPGYDIKLYSVATGESKKLTDGYRDIVAKSGLQGYIISAGANGALMLYPKEIRNYRDWLTVDVDLWRHYWFGMVNRGVMAQPYWWDEQWTISVQHTEADIDKHIAAFADVAPALAKAQQERSAAVVAH